MADPEENRGPRMYARVMVDTSYDLEQKAGMTDNVNLMKGESLEVLEFSSEDWWKVRRCHDGRVMFAPPAYLELDYSRQDSLERRASSLDSPKSSQEGDQSKASKDTLDDESPPEPVERDYLPCATPRSSVPPKSQTNVIANSLSQDTLSSKSPPNSLFAQASLEVHPGDDNDLEDCHEPHVPLERRFRMSLDEALRSRRVKMGEQVDDAPSASDEDSMNENQQTGSDLDDDLVSISPTGFQYNPIQLPPRSVSKPIIRPKSEGGIQPIYANLPLGCGVLPSTPPFPSPNEDPVRYLSDHWAEYRAGDSGRPYYYNYVTGDHSWKPPRRKYSSQHKLTSKSKSESVDNNLDSSVEGIPSPPPSPTEHTASGWSKVYDDISGSMFYMNEVNDERWCSSYDNDGRVYFYQEGTQKTAWELPKIAPCPPQRAHKKSHEDSDCSTTVLRGSSNETDSNSILRTKTLPSGSVKGAPPPRMVPVTSSLSNSDLCEVNRSHKTEKAQPTPQTSLRSLKTRSMILSDLDWRSKSVDIIQGLQQNTHVLSVQKLSNLHDIQEIIKRQGTLNKADLVKAGKKVQKKNWTCCFLVLTSKNLYVYKDAQSGRQPVPGEGALCRLALPGALIEWCPDKSKRKNCFQVSTVQGQKMLFQDDNVQTSREWFESIKGCIIHLPLGYDISGEILKARTPQSTNTTGRDFSVGTLTKDTLKRSKKVLRSKSIKLLRPSSTLPSGGSLGESISASGSTTDLVTLSPNERKRRIGDRLKQFFMRRPTLEMLKEKGIIKDEPVFGCSLAALCSREKADVPKFVVQCINAIENKDMRADGIYRASGNLSQVQKVRFSINNEDYSVLDKEEDVHVLTGALKMFFRDMKEPLIPFSMFDSLLEATTVKERSVKLKTFDNILKELPTVNRDTLQYLLEHLLRVKEYSSENRMHIQNLAIVFGPTLLTSADRTSRNIAMDTIQQNQNTLCAGYGRFFSKGIWAETPKKPPFPLYIHSTHFAMQLGLEPVKINVGNGGFSNISLNLQYCVEQVETLEHDGNR